MNNTITVQIVVQCETPSGWRDFFVAPSSEHAEVQDWIEFFEKKGRTPRVIIRETTIRERPASSFKLKGGAGE